MKFTFIPAFLALFWISCATQKNQVENLEGSWELAVFPNTDKSFEEMFKPYRPELEFSKSSETVSGTTGCNRLRGKFSADYDRFVFANEIITTKMACPGYNENLFLDAIRKINRFQLVENQLRFYQDSSLVMAFSRKTTP